MGHGHAGGHEKPHKPHQEKQREKTVHQSEQHKNQYGGKPPNALDKAARGDTLQPSEKKAAHEKHAEKKTGAATPNAFDKGLREQPQDGRNNEHTPAQFGHRQDRARSPQEAAERLRIATPADGVGFQFDSAELVPGMMEQWQASLPANLRAALTDPNAYVVIVATASRPGPEDYNQQLSSDRGNSVKDWLQDQGAQAHIEVRAHGEHDAEEAGKPDNVDDASDRVANIYIMLPPLPAEGANWLLSQAPQPEQEDKTGEALQEFAEIAKRTLKDISKAPEAPEYAIAKGIEKAVGWMIKHSTQDIKEAKIESEISSNFIPGFKSEIARLTGLKQHSWPGPFSDGAFTQRGKETALQIWNNLPEYRQIGLTALAHSPQGEAFFHQLEADLHSQYISRDNKYFEVHE